MTAGKERRRGLGRRSTRSARRAPSPELDPGLRGAGALQAGHGNQVALAALASGGSTTGPELPWLDAARSEESGGDAPWATASGLGADAFLPLDEEMCEDESEEMCEDEREEEPVGPGGPDAEGAQGGDGPADGDAPADGGPGDPTTTATPAPPMAPPAPAEVPTSTLAAPPAPSGPRQPSRGSARSGRRAGRPPRGGNVRRGAMARLQEDLAGASPAQIAAFVDGRVSALAATAETLRADLDPDAATADLETWSAHAAAQLDARASGVEAAATAVFATPTALVDTLLADVPVRIQAAHEAGRSALEAQREGLRAAVTSAFEAQHPRIAELHTTSTGRADTLQATLEAGIRTVAGQHRAEARDVARRAAAAHTSAEDEDEAAANARKASVADAAGRNAASAIDRHADAALRQVAAERATFDAARDAAVRGLEASWSAALARAEAAVDVQTDAALADADAEAARVDTTVTASREAARQTLLSAEAALAPTVHAAIDAGHAAIDARVAAAREALPEAARQALAALDDTLVTVWSHVDTLRAETDPEAVRAMLADLDAQLAAAGAAARTAVADARTAAQTGIQDEADAADAAVDGLLTDAEADAAATIDGLETSAEAEVSAFETRMSEAAGHVEVGVLATRDTALQGFSDAAAAAATQRDTDLGSFESLAGGHRDAAATAMRSVVADLPGIIAAGATAARWLPAMSADELVATAEAAVAEERRQAALIAQVDPATLQGRLATLLGAGRNGAITVEALKGLDEAQTAALDALFEDATGQDLASALADRGMGAEHLAAATALLDGDEVGAALAELRLAQEAGEGLFVDKVDPVKVRRALQGLSAEEIDEVRRRAASDPAAARTVALCGDVFDRTADETRAADDAADRIPAGFYAQHGLDADDPRALAALTGRDLADLADTIGYTNALNLGERAGMDPASLEGARYIADPDRDAKDRMRQARLELDLMHTDRHGGEWENEDGVVERTGGRLGAGGIFRNPITCAQTAGTLDANMARAAEAMADGDVDEAELAAMTADRHAGDKAVQGQFNATMDTLEDVKTGLEITRDVTTFGAKKLAWLVGFVKSGGNPKAAAAAETTMGAGIEFFGNTANNYFGVDANGGSTRAVDLGTAAQWGAEDSALSLGKGYTNLAMPTALKPLTDTGWDVARDVNDSERRHAHFSEQFMADGVIDANEAAYLDGVAPDELRLWGSVAKHGGNNLMNSLLGAGSGDSPAAAGGGAVVHNAFGKVWGGAVDGTVEDARRARREGRDLDLWDSVGHHGLASAERYRDDFSVWGDLLKPGMEGYAGKALENGASRSHANVGTDTAPVDDGSPVTRLVERQIDGAVDADVAAGGLATRHLRDGGDQADMYRELQDMKRMLAGEAAPDAPAPEAPAPAEAELVPEASPIHPDLDVTVQAIDDQQRMHDRGAHTVEPGPPLDLDTPGHDPADNPVIGKVQGHSLQRFIDEYHRRSVGDPTAKAHYGDDLTLTDMYEGGYVVSDAGRVYLPSDGQPGPYDHIDFGAELRGQAGPAPADMPDPHAHHILFKVGNGAAQQTLVDRGQDVLRAVGIDPIRGPENLVWAPQHAEGQHSADALEPLVADLEAVLADGGGRSDVAEVLRHYGAIAAARR